MIDFAGLVGRITGKGADVAAQASAGQARAGETGVATGGQFAALVSLAAELGAGQDQAKLRLVVDNGTSIPAAAPLPAGNFLPVQGGDTPDGPTLGNDCDMPAPPMPGVTIVDPSTSSKIEAWTAALKQPAPLAADAVRMPIATVPVATPPVTAADTDAAEAAEPCDAAGSGDEADATALDLPASDDGSDAADGDRVAIQIAAVPQPVPFDPARAAGMTVAMPVTGTDSPLPATPSDETPIGVDPLASRPAKAPRLPGIAIDPLVKYANQTRPMIVDEPIAKTVDPAAMATTSPALPQVAPLAQAANADRPMSVPAPQGPASTTATPAEQAAPTVLVAAPAAPAASIPEPTAPASSAPASTATGNAVPEEQAQAAPDRPILAAGALPGGARALQARLRAAQRGAATDARAETVQTASVESAARRDETSRAPVAAATKSGEPVSAIAATSDSPLTSAPLRAIVDTLPPVVQSELSAPDVRGVTGPSTGQALGDQVIDMGVSGQWIDRVAREIAGLADGTGHSRFTLNPPHLGKLQVDLWQDQDSTNVRLIVETDEAARRLNDGRLALQNDARVASLSLGSVTVEKASTSSDSARDQGRDQQRQGSELSGQTQQQAGGQAQGRAGSGGNGHQGQTSDWVRRVARDDTNQPSDASARAPAQRAANGGVRFA